MFFLNGQMQLAYLRYRNCVRGSTNSQMTITPELLTSPDRRAETIQPAADESHSQRRYL